MKQFLIHNAKTLPAVLAMLLATVSICSYWFLFDSNSLKSRILENWKGDKGLILHIILLKYASLLIMAVLPVSVFLFIFPSYRLENIGIAYNPITLMASLKWILLLGTGIVFMNWFAARRSNNFQHYPQIRVKTWTPALVWNYAMAWSAYLLGYEVLFRGLLLFPVADCLGALPAVAINTMLYATSHMPKGSQETFAAMLFGPLLCYITLETGTIWAAWIIHAILAVSNSLIALVFHPEFRISSLKAAQDQ